MLKHLTIQNYALISHLEIDFSEGLSVMTGETGAGKSIILGAIALMLGQRADVKSIQQDENKCLIEGVFDISGYDLSLLFGTYDWEYDKEQCIIRREIYATGKSRAFINDVPVGLNDLKELGSRLIDVHSQHQNLSLADGAFQLQVIDALAGNQTLKMEYGKLFHQWSDTSRKIEQLRSEAEKNAADADYMQFQFNQLDEAKLVAGEQQALEAEAETLSHIEEIKSKLYQIDQLLSGENYPVMSALKEVQNVAQSLHSIFPSSQSVFERLDSSYQELKDISMEVGHLYEKLELDPERLQWVNDRLDLLYSLQQKHKVSTVDELIVLRNQLAEKLQAVFHYDEQLALLQKELKALSERLTDLSGKLTQTRKQAAQQLQTALVEKVSLLGMPHMQFAVEFAAKVHPDASGADIVRFLFSANKNVAMKPVSETASGGEISRLMLGVKALIASSVALPTIIFDEIDTGISGEVADKMGSIMQELGQVMQVLVITHLPQIAAKGQSHYFVYKDEANHRTETHIKVLSPEERITEIAQMLSGAKLTEAAIENAKVLLK